MEYAEYIKQNVNIVDVVERAGITLRFNKACCPFHQEKTPSFSVHPDKNIFKCFGCGAGGDVIGFVQQFYNIDFMGAVKLLNTEYGLCLDIGREHSRTTDTHRQYAVDMTVKRIYTAKFKRYETALLKYRQKLHNVITNYNPPREIADFSEDYTTAVKCIDRIDYYCDVMAYGSLEDKKDLIGRNEVRNIERMFKQ